MGVEAVVGLVAKVGAGCRIEVVALPELEVGVEGGGGELDSVIGILCHRLCVGVGVWLGWHWCRYWLVLLCGQCPVSVVRAQAVVG